MKVNAMDSMSLSILILSLNHFEVSLQRAAEASTRSDSSIRDWIQSCKRILKQQKKLAMELCEHAASGDWSAAATTLAAIRELSAMIRDDASELIQRGECEVGHCPVGRTERLHGPSRAPLLLGLRRVG